MRILCLGLAAIAFLPACTSIDIGERAAAIEEALPRTCDGSNFPNSPSQCCHKGNESWSVGSSGQLLHRRYGDPCHNEDGSACGMNIGDSLCQYGPCGATNLSMIPAPAVVFKPLGDPTECGWQAGGSSFPEPYTGQETWPGVTATCTKNFCRTDGTPTIGFRVRVTAVESGATGHVATRPGKLKLAGAGADAWVYEQNSVVELVAHPHGDHARAVLSGACTAVGPYGAKAGCTLTGVRTDRNVTVTWQCEPGFGCD